MSGLSKLETGLIVVFIVSLLALLGELCYVLWCRRRFRQQNPDADIDFPSLFKELLCFFCWKNHSRIEPAGASATRSTDPQDASSESGDPLKRQELYGPPGLLFTIEEEEREDLDFEKFSVEHKTKSVSLEEECFQVNRGERPPAAAVTVDVEYLDAAETPFSTPPDSPHYYYTPSPSPPRRVRRSVESLTEFLDNRSSFVSGVYGVQIVSPERVFSGENEAAFINVEVHGG